MDILFIHGAFPAQFGRLALELTSRYGWKCRFLVEHLSICPTPSPEMLERLERYPLEMPPGCATQADTPWPQVYGRALEVCRAVYEAVRSRPQLRPDLVVGYHGGGAPTLFR